MSPVFRHGRLRLYLLALLAEAPRHGYEVIRLLQDQFLGVYAPSPGTIYPRLARLEEEGLVTHEEVAGRKVYRITDAGREQLRARLDEVTALEQEITASVRGIAREVTEDVRETVRSLREEFASAARDAQARSATPGRSAAAAGRREPGQRGRAPADGHGRDGTRWGAHDPGARGPVPPGWRPHGCGPSPCRDPRAMEDVDRVIRRFTGELRRAARHAEAAHEDAAAHLSAIFAETLARIQTEVFGQACADGDAGSPPGAADGPRASGRPTEPGR